VNAKLQALIDSAKKSWTAGHAGGRTRVNVTLDTSSLARGGDQTLAAIRKAVADRGLDADVGITGSWGFCWMEPCVTVRSAAGTRTVLYGNVTPDVADEFVRQTILEGGDMPELALGVVDGNATDEIPLLSDHPVMRGQTRRLMENIGMTAPENIDHYLAHDGYVGFGKALDMDAEAIVKECSTPGWVAGGRRLPHRKEVDFLRNATADPRYMICNADEGDPGAWVNRILMEGDPHLIVEGCSSRRSRSLDRGLHLRPVRVPVGGRADGEAVDQAYAKGLLGKDILGTGKDFDLYVVKARARMSAVRRRASSRRSTATGDAAHQAAVPGAGGLWNKPSNVNNVESYANAPMIMRNGAQWWSAVSEAKEKGHEDVHLLRRRELGGVHRDPLRAERARGPGALRGRDEGGEHAQRLPAGGAALGHARRLGHRPHAHPRPLPRAGDVPRLGRHRLLRRESVRHRHVQVLPRVLRGRELRALHDLPRWHAARGRDPAPNRAWRRPRHGHRETRRIGADTGVVELSARAVRDDEHQDRAQGFRDEFDEHIEQKRCRAGVCTGLIEYRVRSQSDPGLPAAEEICPTGAAQREGGQYVIVDQFCIRCGACKEQAPDGIEVRERFAVDVAMVAVPAAG
jgi:(2Fe-2S) ferredoxin/NAD-dependent dihydropyrimidine dehydrogenase PreA subunit